MAEGCVYNGGTAAMVEKLFNVTQDGILYVGDHIFSDVSIAKASNRWRTLLVHATPRHAFFFSRGGTEAGGGLCRCGCRCLCVCVCVLCWGASSEVCVGVRQR